MKIVSMWFLFLVFFSFNIYGAPRSEDLKKVIDSVHFKQAWVVKPFFDSFELNSPVKVTPPDSKKEEAQTSIFIGLSSDKMKPGTSLAKILQDEILRAQKGWRITDYLEKDKKPINNIVSYQEKIGNGEVGILQYRTSGEKDDPPGSPRSVKQVLFLKADQLFNIVLMAFDSPRLDEARADQMELVKALLQSQL